MAPRARLNRWVGGVLLACAGWLAACSPPKGRAEAAAPKAPALPWVSEPEPAAPVSSPLVALVGGTLMTGTGTELEDAAIVFGSGRILAVGPRASVAIPDGAEVVDVAGRWVTPGLIDAHSHMGVYPVPFATAHGDGNEMTRPVTANVRAADAFWPQDPAISRALAAGVTTVLVLPGSANLIGGQGVTLKLRPGRSARDMLFPGAPPTLKMACGENPKRVYGERRSFPSTRMGNMAGYREAFQSAREYQAKFTEWQARHLGWQKKNGAASGEPAPSPPARDFGLEALVGALEGRVLLEIHCYRADEMLSMLALAEEYGLNVRAFHHAVEAYKIRDVLAARQVGVATWADWWGFKLEAFDTIRENLALLAAAGVRGALHSDSASLVQRLNQEAAKSLAAGKRANLPIDRGAALAWITSGAAWVLGVEEQTGSLEVGKMADVVLWSRDPFSVYSRVERVYVDGVLLHDREAGEGRSSDFEVGLGAELPDVPSPPEPPELEPPAKRPGAAVLPDEPSPPMPPPSPSSVPPAPAPPHAPPAPAPSAAPPPAESAPQGPAAPAPEGAASPPSDAAHPPSGAAPRPRRGASGGEARQAERRAPRAGVTLGIEAGS